MANEDIRTFVAVEVPAETQAAMEAAVEPVRRSRRWSGIGWTAQTGWHLTLRFLGELAPPRIEEVVNATRAVAALGTSFRATLDGWGVFPSERRPRVLWLGLAEGAELLVHIAADLEARLAERGFEREERPFHPHLTIARIKEPGAGIEAYRLLMERTLEPHPFSVDRLVVFRSILGRSGAEYHHIADCPLGG